MTKKTIESDYFTEDELVRLQADVSDKIVTLTNRRDDAVAALDAAYVRLRKIQELLLAVSSEPKPSGSGPIRNYRLDAICRGAIDSGLWKGLDSGDTSGLALAEGGVIRGGGRDSIPAGSCAP